MNYWLIKSEPSEYSWFDLEKDGKTVWTGVRNYAARNNLKEMKVGDLTFFYHSNQGKEIVGIAKVSKEYFNDPTSDDDRWVSVEFVPVEKLERSVTLEEIKSTPTLQDMQIVKLSRLSVSKVTTNEFKRIQKLANKK